MREDLDRRGVSRHATASGVDRLGEEQVVGRVEVERQRAVQLDEARRRRAAAARVARRGCRPEREVDRRRAGRAAARSCRGRGGPARATTSGAPAASAGRDDQRRERRRT